ncbi:hypothetical protein [Azospirillum doebereinerae]|uniref:Uncharacterized protein n=1 Tax=Azospirillum doebereinerae TaxID=92933 RepID=A0A433J6Q4_9PROT|nr:hypothetical protein [Azospirillum doebereinerae]MCG5238985.1 hypothetical protein [Azospirillum doebereinerae]RUQ68850.1 hypothetical protein EJ913_16860 [Azospirillum doebereinerae]
MSPVPFFQQVRQVGVLCAMDAAPERAGVAPDEAALCGLAVAEMKSLIGVEGPTTTALVRNDERVGDSGTLVVLLHATLRDAPPGSVLALSASLYRARPDVGAPPFFVAPPQGVVAAGEAVPLEDARGALRQLLAGVARAIRTNR